MNNIQSLGKFGENVAVKHLLKNNYTIIKRNFRCSFGEIDIIAKKNDVLVFIEVKTRRNINFGYPIEAITFEKQKHIYNTAKYYLLNSKIDYNNIRIDGIEIYVNKHGFSLNHIENIITN